MSPYIREHKLKIDSMGSKNLYHGFPSMSDRLVSIRLMTSMAIGGTIFHDDVKSEINNCIRKFHDYEQYFENQRSLNSPIHYYLPYISAGNISYIINSECSGKTNYDQNKCNSHHIFPKSGFAIESSKLILGYCRSRKEFSQKYPLRLRNQFSAINGTDDDVNLKALTINRHKGLNMRYDPKMLPHHQMIAEILYIENNLMRIWKNECKEIHELYVILNKPYIEDLYKEDCYHLAN